MNFNETDTTHATHRLLVVADRSADATPLVDAVRKRAEGQRIEATVVVPATLHGVEWAGDPHATAPAAARHAALVQVSLLNAGAATCHAKVGDPDARAAIDDALAAERFDEVLINMRSHLVTRALRLSVADQIGSRADANVTYLRPARGRRAQRASTALARSA
jgi:hypothetical protein